jgi:hypothetical protein
MFKLKKGATNIRKDLYIFMFILFIVNLPIIYLFTCNGDLEFHMIYTNLYPELSVLIFSPI